MPEGGLEDDSDDEFDENPFHGAGPVIINAVRGGLEERSHYAFDLDEEIYPFHEDFEDEATTIKWDDYEVV